MRDELTNTCLLPESAPLSGRRALPLRVDDGEASVSAVPEAEQCGWLKDKFGLFWQIVPREIIKHISSKDPAKVDRVMQAVMDSVKFDIKLIRAAANAK